MDGRQSPRHFTNISAEIGQFSLAWAESAEDFLTHFEHTRPFTLLLLVTLTVIAVATNSHSGDLPARWQHRLGISAKDVWNTRWPRMVTAALVTKGGWVFAEALAMIILAVGTAEWMTSTRRATATFGVCT